MARECELVRPFAGDAVVLGDALGGWASALRKVGKGAAMDHSEVTQEVEILIGAEEDLEEGGVVEAEDLRQLEVVS